MTLLFYFFSLMMLVSGICVIACRNPVNSAMFLVVAFFFMAGLFVLLQAWFLAAVQVLVYAGAIMVLFLFVIMLLNTAEEEKRRFRFFGLAMGLGIMVLMVFLMLEFSALSYRSNLPAQPVGDLVGTTEKIGRLLYSSYLAPFEVAGVLLLAAMIGVIVLARQSHGEKGDRLQPSA